MHENNIFVVVFLYIYIYIYIYIYCNILEKTRYFNTEFVSLQYKNTNQY